MQPYQMAGWAAVLCLLAKIAGAVEVEPTIEDLVQTRAIDGVTVSPDRKRVAFRVLTPSLARNGTRAQWRVVPMSGGGGGQALGGESEPIWVPNYDFPEEPLVLWAYDSCTIFVRQLDGGEVQVHRIGPGKVDRRVTNDPADVVSFTLSPDGSVLHYKTHAPRAEIDRAIAAEKRSGVRLSAFLNTDGMRIVDNFRIGSRITTLRRINGSVTGEAFAGELRDRRVRLAPTAGASSTPPADDLLDLNTADDVKRALHFQRTGVSVRLRALQRDEILMRTRYQVVATLPDGTEKPCPETFCTGSEGSALRLMTLHEATQEVVILFEKDYSARSILYGWAPATGATRVIFDADGSLGRSSGIVAGPCQRGGGELVCVHAGPTRPPRLIRIDLSTGATVTLADPNEALAAKRFGTTEFLEWVDEDGRPSNGVLVLPRSHSGPLPLIISSYRCRGFLRGGTAEVVPEHIATQMGFAAVCVNSFNEAASERDAEGKQIVASGHKATLKSWAAIVDLLAKRGLVDRSKVGAAGHSFSGIGLTYVISHSDLLAAAVLSGTTTLDPSSLFIRSPSADSPMKAYPKAMNLPDPNNDPEGIWKQVSPSLNADKIHAALLIQTPESEYLPDLQLHAAITDAGGVVDTYIFPDEGHMVGRYPVHQYWRNRRSLDWFAFWLQGRENRTPETNWQFDLWERLRANRKTP